MTTNAPEPRDSGLELAHSSDLTPHFEQVNGRQVFYVEGWPFTVLTVEIPTELAQWPALQQIRVERGRWKDGRHWERLGECWYTINQSARAVGLRLDVPQAVRVYL